MDRHKCAEFLDIVVLVIRAAKFPFTVGRKGSSDVLLKFPSDATSSFYDAVQRVTQQTVQSLTSTRKNIPLVQLHSHLIGAALVRSLTDCHRAWNVRCYWRKLISQKMSSKQISMLKFADLWVVISCKLAHVYWSSRGKCYLHYHRYSRNTYRTSTLNMPRHVPEKRTRL
jgi:hypothetical protein